MTARTHTGAPVATVDVRQLNTLNEGLIRTMFPSFVGEIELAHYVKRLLANSQCRGVQIEPHRDADGVPSTHVFDIYFVDEPAPEQ